MSREAEQSLQSQGRRAATESVTEVPNRAEAAKLPHGRGPRSQRGEVRQRILKEARAQFTSKGYDDVTMSQIAKNAGCTPAMVTYYFESKSRLFRECMDLPVDPASMILEVLAEGREGAGERVVSSSLQLYEEQFTKDTMLALMNALMTDAATSQRFREYVSNDVMGEVSDELGMNKELAEEIEFAIATMFGVVTMRYLVRLEPLASMSHERLVRELGPIVQHRIDRAFARRDLRGGH